MLDLRDLVRKFIWVKIGDGKSCSLWYDKWHSIGPLCKFIDSKTIIDVGLDVKAKVADLVNNQEWNWPIEWDVKSDNVRNIHIPKLDACKKDVTVWINKKGKEVDFSTKEVWKALSEDSPRVI